MKKRLYITAMSILAVTTMVVLAQPHGPRDGRGGPGAGGNKGCVSAKWLMSHPKIAEKVGLTDEDVQKLGDMEYEQQKTVIPLHAQQRLAQLELDYLLDQDTPDKDAVNKAIDDLGAVENSLQKAQINYLLEVKAALGPEKMQQLKQARRNFAKSRRNKKDGPHGKRNRKGGQKGKGPNGKGMSKGGPEMSDMNPAFEDDYMDVEFEEFAPEFDNSEG